MDIIETCVGNAENLLLKKNQSHAARNVHSAMLIYTVARIIIQEPIPRDAECPFCHADIHSCKNCVFYEPGSHYDCNETVDELVVDKEHANFCDAFSLNKVSSKMYVFFFFSHTEIIVRWPSYTTVRNF